MQRITVSLDDGLAAFVRQEVGAGRASSVSAYLADRVRDVAIERAELLARLESEASADPLDVNDLAWVARAVQRDRDWVETALGRARS